MTKTFSGTIPAHISALFRQMSDYVPSYYTARGQELRMHEPCVILNEQNLFVDGSVRVDSFTKLECGLGTVIDRLVHIASFCHLGIGGGLMILEEGSSFGSGAKIITGSNVPGVGRGCSAIDPDAVIEKSFVHIKARAVLFAGAIVLPGITIGEESVIAAGAVVTRDVPDGETWAGVPARCVKKRLLSAPAKSDLILPDDRLEGSSPACPDLYVQAMDEFYGWSRV